MCNRWIINILARQPLRGIFGKESKFKVWLMLESDTDLFRKAWKVVFYYLAWEGILLKWQNWEINSPLGINEQLGNKKKTGENDKSGKTIVPDSVPPRMMAQVNSQCTWHFDAWNPENNVMVSKVLSFAENKYISLDWWHLKVN